jgi:transposase
MLSNTTISVPAKRAEGRRKQLVAGPRGRYSLDFKLKVLKETFAPGTSVAVVARRHGMNANVIFRWKKEFREGRLGEGAPRADKQLRESDFVPVRVVQDVPALPAPERIKPAARAKPGVIHLTLPGGFALRVDADIDDAALRRVLRAVRDLA